MLHRQPYTITKSLQAMYAHLLPTWIRKLGPTLLLITYHDLAEPLKSVIWWRLAQFQAGWTVDDIGIQLAISSS